eukprot:scaffold6154_cov153-Pinguiococcus_pyrenoidosus.AAC.3
MVTRGPCFSQPAACHASVVILSRHSWSSSSFETFSTPWLLPEYVTAITVYSSVSWGSVPGGKERRFPPVTWTENPLMSLSLSVYPF